MLLIFLVTVFFGVIFFLEHPAPFPFSQGGQFCHSQPRHHVPVAVYIISVGISRVLFSD